MIIRPLSDLHFEFHADNGREFINSLDLTGVDVLVLAGDINTKHGLERSLQDFSKKFSGPIIFVPGNHEYYNSSPDEIHKLLSCAEKDNIIILNTANWDDYRWDYEFIGATLWFPLPKYAHKSQINDFSCIKNLEPWVYEQHEKAKKLLEVSNKDSIVITHHLPSFQCVHPNYFGSTMNEFFASNQDRIIEINKPKLWIHGHTHKSVDKIIGETRIVCNPFGYAGYDVNPDFNPNLNIEV